MNMQIRRSIAILALPLLAIVFAAAGPIRAETAIGDYPSNAACNAGQAFALVDRPAQPVWGDDDEDGEDYEGSGRPDID